jgi:hypothetical protein
VIGGNALPAAIVGEGVVEMLPDGFGFLRSPESRTCGVLRNIRILLRRRDKNGQLLRPNIRCESNKNPAKGSSYGRGEVKCCLDAVLLASQSPPHSVTAFLLPQETVFDLRIDLMQPLLGTLSPILIGR